MASELSKLIEDQLQKVDEESGVPPSEKQRLLSSSLRIKVGGQPQPQCVFRSWRCEELLCRALRGIPVPVSDIAWICIASITCRIDIPWYWSIADVAGQEGRQQAESHRKAGSHKRAACGHIRVRSFCASTQRSELGHCQPGQRPYHHLNGPDTQGLGAPGMHV